MITIKHLNELFQIINLHDKKLPKFTDIKHVIMWVVKVNYYNALHSKICISCPLYELFSKMPLDMLSYELFKKFDM